MAEYSDRIELECLVLSGNGSQRDELTLSGPDPQGDFSISSYDYETDQWNHVWINAGEARRLFGWLGVRLHT